jgi:PHD/YefM family antitoxin component YafN of YafNO toxin-antitoxin module
MKTLTVEEARNQFDAMFSTANHEPIEIMQDGTRVGVFLPYADAELIEDMLLAQKVNVAKEGSMLGVDATAKLLDRICNAKD